MLLVAACASGQGKTTATCALARRLRRAGERVRVFKIGADFIDPLFLEIASGHPVHPLDLWMVGREQCRALVAQAAATADTVLIEGAMGLYDGEPSAGDLARELGIPVLLVIDVQALAQTAGALVQGLRDFGPVRVAGVLANGIAGTPHAQMIAAALRDVPLLGTLPVLSEPLPERHLGLTLPAASDDIDRQIDHYASLLTLDEQQWSAVAPPAQATTDSPVAWPAVEPLLEGRLIAVARDAAFAFLYASNIDCLQALGARIAWFSPLADADVPAGADAIWLPGGYPELHGAVLSEARRFHRSLRAAHAAGVPILAECGGMMALTDALVDLSGREWRMAGLLSGKTRMQARLAAIGLQSWDTGHGVVRGHAFHYSVFDTPLRPAGWSVRHPRGEPGEGVYAAGALVASYFHGYFPSNPRAVAALLSGAVGTRVA